MDKRGIGSLARYEAHLRGTVEWLVRSIEHGRGGSCAHFSLASGWSRPYPETTGYLIPTLLALDGTFPELALRERALALGRWLVGIRNDDGSWNGGLHPSPGAKPSVFNTGQVLDGLVALHRSGAGAEFLEAAQRGACWLASGMERGGLWRGAAYRASETPSYFTHALWPMLEVWSETGEADLRSAAEGGLAAIVARIGANGWIARAGFDDEERAFTHTIAYAIRGLLEGSRILGAWDDLGSKAVPALERMLRKAELGGGRLAGELDAEWRALGRFECLTGSAQMALNLLLWERHEPDLRIVNGAAKLVDRVCATQDLRHALAGVRGGVAGSAPVWGRYMVLRYPNWAAKFHGDALLAVRGRIEREIERPACASS